MNETCRLFLLRTLNCYDIGYKTFEMRCAQQFVEMLLLQNKPWLVRYEKKNRAMSFLPSVECDKFMLKKGFLKRQDFSMY